MIEDPYDTIIGVTVESFKQLPQEVQEEMSSKGFISAHQDFDQRLIVTQAQLKVYKKWQKQQAKDKKLIAVAAGIKAGISPAFP